MADAAASGPRRGRRRRWVRRVGLAAALVLAGIGGANAFLVATTRDRVRAGVADVPPSPVAVVLGTTVYADGSPSVGLAARLRRALELYQAGRVQRVVVSGAWRPPYDEPGAMARWLAARGVPDGSIVLDRGGHRTAATMAGVAAMGMREVVLCTQGYHLPRSLYLARHAGIDALGVAADDEPAGAYMRFRALLREALARAEALIEVAIVGVRAG